MNRTRPAPEGSAPDRAATPAGPDTPFVGRDGPDIANLVGPERPFHISRLTVPPRRPRDLPERPFPLLGWVQNGTVRLHDRGGRRDLPEGRMFFAATGQPHALQGRGEAPMIVSVAFDPALVAGLAARHPQLGGHLFWAGAERPELDALDSRALADLNRAALRLERAAATSLAAEAFLLPLVARLAERRTAIPDGLPDWLARAMEAARDPAVFREGAAGLARVAGRAHPHVSRTMRRFTGQTPSDYVNARRMDFAARRLAGGEEPLAEIAAECGIPNLSHFHRLFRVAHGTTPAAYRRRFRAALERP